MSSVVLAFRRTFHSLRSWNFRLYLAGLAISATGIWIHAVASAWLVLNLTGSGVALGLEMMFMFLPILFLGAWGGVVADRFDKRRVLLGVLTATGVVRLWMVYAISFAVGIVTTVDHPTRQSFVPEMVARRDLTNAVSLNSAVFTGTRIVGPAIGAAVIAAVGIAPAFLLDGVSYLAVVGGLLLMRRRELRPADRAPEGERGLGEGLRYVARTRELRLPLVLMAVLFAFSFNFMVLLPLMADRAFAGGAGTYGSLLSVMGLGSFVGALVLAHRSSPGVRLMCAAGAAVGVFSLAAALAPTLRWEWAFVAPLGFAAISFMIVGNTTLQLTSEATMRGRVMSLYSVVFLGSTPIGAPIAGWIGQHLGPRVGLLAGGMVALLGSLITLWVAHRTRARDVPREATDAVVPVPVGEAAAGAGRPREVERTLSA
jgi:predicted MFS family arabinose efflux permease